MSHSLDQTTLSTFNYALSLAQSDQKSEAHKILIDLCQVHPTNTGILLWLAFTSSSQSEAQNWLGKVSQLEPNNPSLSQAYDWLTTNPAFRESEAQPDGPKLNVPDRVAPLSATTPPDHNSLASKYSIYKQFATGPVVIPKQVSAKKTTTPKKVNLTIRLLLVTACLLALIVTAALFWLKPAINDGFFTNGSIQHLNYRVIDSAYSSSLDLMIMISSSPDQLHIYAPASQKETTIDLKRPPLNLAVSPDGKFVVVGHNALISYIDLQKASLVKTLDLSNDPASLVLTNNGWVYFSPVKGNFHVYGIQTGNGQTITNSDSATFLDQGLVLKLSLDGKSLYGANRNSSPSKFLKVDVSRAVPSFLYEFPYHGEREGCGNLWLAEDGKRIFSACGEVFRASGDKNQDMTYNGKLTGVDSVYYLTHSKATGQILVVPSPTTGKAVYGSFTKRTPGNKIQIFGYENLNFEGSIKLPDFQNNGKNYPALATAVFVNATGTKYYTVVQADEKSGLENGSGLVIDNLSNPKS